MAKMNRNNPDAVRRRREGALDRLVAGHDGPHPRRDDYYWPPERVEAEIKNLERKLGPRLAA